MGRPSGWPRACDEQVLSQPRRPAGGRGRLGASLAPGSRRQPRVLRPHAARSPGPGAARCDAPRLHADGGRPRPLDEDERGRRPPRLRRRLPPAERAAQQPGLLELVPPCPSATGSGRARLDRGYRPGARRRRPRDSDRPRARLPRGHVGRRSDGSSSGRQLSRALLGTRRALRPSLRRGDEPGVGLPGDGPRGPGRQRPCRRAGRDGRAPAPDADDRDPRRLRLDRVVGERPAAGRAMAGRKHPRPRRVPRRPALAARGGRSRAGHGRACLHAQPLERRARSPRGRVLEVAGLGHAWSGGAAGAAWSDARGPDASEAIWRFFSELR